MGAKEAYKQNGELEKLIAELTSAEAEWEQGGEALAKVKDLRDTLKAEAKDLMEKVHSLNSMKNDGGDSAAVGQVRDLQLEISELEQERGEVRAPPPPGASSTPSSKQSRRLTRGGK